MRRSDYRIASRRLVGERGFEPRIALHHNRRFPQFLRNCLPLVQGSCVGVQCIFTGFQMRNYSRRNLRCVLDARVFHRQWLFRKHRGSRRLSLRASMRTSLIKPDRHARIEEPHWRGRRTRQNSRTLLLNWPILNSLHSHQSFPARQFFERPTNSRSPSS